MTNRALFVQLSYCWMAVLTRVLTTSPRRDTGRCAIVWDDNSALLSSSAASICRYGGAQDSWPTCPLCSSCTSGAAPASSRSVSMRSARGRHVRRSIGLQGERYSLVQDGTCCRQCLTAYCGFVHHRTWPPTHGALIEGEEAIVTDARAAGGAGPGRRTRPRTVRRTRRRSVPARRRRCRGALGAEEDGEAHRADGPAGAEADSPRAYGARAGSRAHRQLPRARADPHDRMTGARAVTRTLSRISYQLVGLSGW